MAQEANRNVPGTPHSGPESVPEPRPLILFLDDLYLYPVVLIRLILGGNGYPEDAVFVDRFYLFLGVFVQGDKVFLFFNILQLETPLEIADVFVMDFRRLSPSCSAPGFSEIFAEKTM